MVSIYRVSISRSRTVPKSLFAAVSFCASRGTSRKWRFPTMRPPPRSLRFVAKALLCGRLSRPPPRSALFPTRHNSAAQPISCTTAPPRCARIAPTTVSIPDAVILALLWASSPAQCNTAARPCSLRALPCREQDLRVPLRLQRRNAAHKRRRRRGVECVRERDQRDTL